MLRSRNRTSDAEPQTKIDRNAFAARSKRMLRGIDLFPKLHKEFRVQTESGGLVSVVTGIIMLLLFVFEIRDYMDIRTHEHMIVDSSIDGKLQINLDISLPSLNCKEAHLAAMDVAGDLQVHIHKTIHKTRLDENGRSIMRSSASVKTENAVSNVKNPCGSCHAASVHDIRCCNTCDEVLEAYIESGLAVFEAAETEQCLQERDDEEKYAKDGEGCRIAGNFMVNRVAGNFHIGLGRAVQRQGKLSHQFAPGAELKFNSSHIINNLYFGSLRDRLGNGLDGAKATAKKVGGLIRYHIQIVPTVYSSTQSAEQMYQYSHKKEEKYLENQRLTSLPGIFFVYDFSPFMVKIDQDRAPITHFVTRIFAILGGMISIAKFLDSLLFHFLQYRRRSMSSSIKMRQ